MLISFFFFTHLEEALVNPQRTMAGTRAVAPSLKLMQSNATAAPAMKKYTIHKLNKRLREELI